MTALDKNLRARSFVRVIDLYSEVVTTVPHASSDNENEKYSTGLQNVKDYAVLNNRINKTHYIWL